MPAAQSPKAESIGQALPARHFPLRTCVACRAERQKREFLRIVRAPDATVSIDASGKSSGRGAYLCADGSCWAAALKKKSIERALGVALPADVRVRLEGGVGHGPQ